MQKRYYFNFNFFVVVECDALLDFGYKIAEESAWPLWKSCLPEKKQWITLHKVQLLVIVPGYYFLFHSPVFSPSTLRHHPTHTPALFSTSSRYVFNDGKSDSKRILQKSVFLK